MSFNAAVITGLFFNLNMRQIAARSGRLQTLPSSFGLSWTGGKEWSDATKVRFIIL